MEEVAGGRRSLRAEGKAGRASTRREAGRNVKAARTVGKVGVHRKMSIQGSGSRAEGTAAGMGCKVCCSLQRPEGDKEKRRRIGRGRSRRRGDTSRIRWSWECRRLGMTRERGSADGDQGWRGWHCCHRSTLELPSWGLTVFVGG